MIVTKAKSAEACFRCQTGPLNMLQVIFPVPGEGPLTMSSREIAELTGRAHHKVMRDIRHMIEELEEEEVNLSNFGLVSYRDEKNREYPEYHLPKDLSICRVSGYDVKLRLAIIRRS